MNDSLLAGRQPCPTCNSSLVRGVAANNKTRVSTPENRRLSARVAIDRWHRLAYGRRHARTQARFRLIAELKSYRGVSCVRCGAAIPISEKVTDLENEIARGEVNVPHAFTARCKVCEWESVYQISDIRTFEGQPTKRKRKAHAA